MCGSEANKRPQLFTVFQVLNSTKLEDRTICLLDLLEFIRIFLRNSHENLDQMFDDDVFELFQESI